jgi:hypothetical protein
MPVVSTKPAHGALDRCVQSVIVDDCQVDSLGCSLRSSFGDSFVELSHVCTIQSRCRPNPMQTFRDMQAADEVNGGIDVNMTEEVRVDCGMGVYHISLGGGRSQGRTKGKNATDFDHRTTTKTNPTLAAYWPAYIGFILLIPPRTTLHRATATVLHSCVSSIICQVTTPHRSRNTAPLQRAVCLFCFAPRPFTFLPAILAICRSLLVNQPNIAYIALERPPRVSYPLHCAPRDLRRHRTPG